MRLAVTVILLILCATGYAQQKPFTPPSDFDFWIGTWEVSWKNKEGATVIGSNTISRILDGSVLQENFYDPNTGFKGSSLTVWSPTDSTWHQAWADNQGGYFNFVGSRDGEKRIFQTPATDKRGMIWRMVFYDISPNQFTWDWQGSKDNGKTWDLMWRIFYKRK